MSRSKAYKKLLELLALEKEAELKQALLELAREKLELQLLRRREKMQRIIYRREGWKQYVS